VLAAIMAEVGAFHSTSKDVAEKKIRKACGRSNGSVRSKKPAAKR
jgi:hypothetical protein